MHLGSNRHGADFPIVDGHAHIFPPLDGANGFSDIQAHRMYIQRAMHTHLAQPVRRSRDHAIVTEPTLWDPDDPSPSGMRQVDFRVGQNGRFEWSSGGEGHYIQFMPPSLQAMEAPAGYLVAEMDYAGIDIAVLQNDPIYGQLDEMFATATGDYPGRFIGLARVEEAVAYEESQIQRLCESVERLGMGGLYYNVSSFFLTGYRSYYSDHIFEGFWSEVERLRLPVFWVIPSKSPVGDYQAEMSHFRSFLERFSSIPSVLVHGLPDGLFMDGEGRLALPPWIMSLMADFPVYLEVLFAIKWGGHWEYPYPEAAMILRQYYDRFGPERLIWGSDMPNVLRYCTYAQAFNYLQEGCGFLSIEDRQLLFGGNVLALLERGNES